MPNLAAVARAYSISWLDRSSHTSENHTTSQRQAFIRDDYIGIRNRRVDEFWNTGWRAFVATTGTCRTAGDRPFLNGWFLDLCRVITSIETFHSDGARRVAKPNLA